MVAGIEQLADDLRGAYGRAEHQVRLGPLQERPRAVPVLGRAGAPPARAPRIGPPGWAQAICSTRRSTRQAAEKLYS